MRPPLRDLFGEIPVSRGDIEAWLRAVPRIDPESPRAARYVIDWNVAGKVRAAKERGDFELLTRPRDRSGLWWLRFRW